MIKKIKISIAASREYREKKRLDQSSFRRDSDRILYALIFRLLTGKTCVYDSNGSDILVRTRYDHTIEVSRTSFTAGLTIGLEPDLCEAIAFAHDLGHPPFGHSGEGELNECLKLFGKEFNHDYMAFLTVTSLERKKIDYKGLNLTYAVRSALEARSKRFDLIKDRRAKQKPLVGLNSLESQCVELSHRIVFPIHDIEDTILLGHLGISELKQIPLLGSLVEDITKELRNEKDIQIWLCAIKEILYYTLLNEGLYKQCLYIKKQNQFQPGYLYYSDQNLIILHPEIRKEFDEMIDWFYQNIYGGKPTYITDQIGALKIRRLFTLLYENDRYLYIYNKYGLPIKNLIEEFSRAEAISFVIVYSTEKDVNRFLLEHDRQYAMKNLDLR